MHLIVRTPVKSYQSSQIKDLTFDELVEITENCTKMFSLETDEGRVVLKSDVLKNSVFEIVK